MARIRTGLLPAVALLLSAGATQAQAGGYCARNLVVLGDTSLSRNQLSASVTAMGAAPAVCALAGSESDILCTARVRCATPLRFSVGAPGYKSYVRNIPAPAAGGAAVRLNIGRVVLERDKSARLVTIAEATSTAGMRRFRLVIENPGDPQLLVTRIEMSSIDPPNPGIRCNSSFSSSFVVSSVLALSATRLPGNAAVAASFRDKDDRDGFSAAASGSYRTESCPRASYLDLALPVQVPLPPKVHSQVDVALPPTFKLTGGRGFAREDLIRTADLRSISFRLTLSDGSSFFAAADGNGALDRR